MRLPALQHRPFRNYLFGLTISNIGTNVQTWAIAWHVYELTQSSLMVGLIGLVRIGPLLVLTLFGGVVADQYDRRKVMLITQSGMSLAALFALLVTATGNATVGILYAIVAFHAIFRAFDGPARQSMFVRLVPATDFMNAVSVNGIAWRLSDIVGPILMGAFVAFNSSHPNFGLSLCYGFNFASFFVVLAAVRSLPPCLPEAANDRPKQFREVITRIKEGWSFVNRTPVVRSAMWIDFWATLCSGAEALLPAMAATVLAVDAHGYGILAASTGVGALIAAAFVAWTPVTKGQGKLVVIMIGCYGIATIAFGLSTSLLTAAIALSLVGACDMVSTVLRQTIRQLATPDHLRGRMNATSSMFHISGPQLGDFEAGVVAALWGERISIIVGGGLCILVAAHWSRAKSLMNYELEYREGK